MLAPNDSFWDVRRREQDEIDALQRDVLACTLQIDLLKKAEAIRHAPGFHDFLTALKGMHSLERDKLVGDNRFTNDGLRELRGRVKALESVLSLLTKPQTTGVLAERLEASKNALAEALKRRPRPKTEDKTKETS